MRYIIGLLGLLALLWYFTSPGEDCETIIARTIVRDLGMTASRVNIEAACEKSPEVCAAYCRMVFDQAPY